MVFENILVRLLNQKIGHYIDGLDTKNLEVGIFSGNIVIENVKLKDSVPELLELPFDIKYSHIKKLVLKIPITNLSGSPVEIELDGLYVLFDVQREVDWMQEYSSIKNKLENVDQYAQDIIEKMIQVQTKQLETKEKAKGNAPVDTTQTYIDRLLIKILDNLQLKISNIHIRIENQIGFKASFGACLQSIGMLTVNDHDEPVFVDRTKPANANLAMTKKLDLKNLGVYVNPNETKFLANKSFEEIQLHLNYSIMKSGQKMNNIINYLFTINLQVRLVQNPKGDFRIPNIVVVADISRLSIVLDQDQLQHAISMLEYMNSYNKHITKLKEKSCTKDLQRQNELIEKFKQVYPIYYYKLDRNLEGLTADQRKQLSEAVEKLQLKILLDQTKIIAGEQLKSQKINEITAKKRGFISRIFRSSSKKNSIVTQKDKENIENFFESIIKQEDSQIQKQAQQNNAPDDYIWLKVKFKFEGGSVYLKKQFQPAEYKGTSFSFSDLLGSVNVKMKGNSITASLKDLSLDIVEEQILKQQKKIINVLGKSSYQQENNIIFFRMDSKQLEDKEERFIKFNLAQAKLQYNRLLIQFLTEFFQVKVQDQELRDQAMKKIEEFHEKTQQQVEDSIKNIDKSKDILKLDVFLASPIIVIPFSSDDNIDALDFLVLQLGNLSIKTDHEEGQRLLQSNALIQDKIEYARKKELNEIYLISLQNINCRYFTTIQTMEQYLQIRTFSLASTHPSIAGSQRESFLIQQQQMQNNREMFVLVQDFSINIKINIAKYQQKMLMKIDIPRISVEGDVTDLSINLNQTVYQKLLSLQDVLDISTAQSSKRQTLQMNQENIDKNNAAEEIITEKKELIKKAVKGGFLFKRGKHIKKWEKYYAVLTRDHIYFFEVQNTFKPLFHIAIKNATISNVAEDQCGFKNAFVIKTRYEDIYLGCEKAENTEKWIKEIQKIYDENEEEKKLYEIQMNELENNNNNNLEDMNIENTDFNAVDLHLNFKINSIQVSLESMEQKLIVDLSIQKFNLNAEKKIASFEADITLEGIYLNDYVYQYQDPSLSYLITSRNEKNDKLINIKILQLDKQHPKHKQDKMDLFLDCEFGCLFINFKPDTFMAIMDFFQIDTETQIIKQLELQKLESQRREEYLLKEKGKDLQNVIPGSDKTSDKLEPENQDGSAEESNLIQNSEVILVKAKVHVRQIALNLVHRKTKLNQNQLNLQCTQIEFIQKADEMVLSGSLQNLQIFDLTNYPNTIYKEEDYKFQRKQEIVGLWYETEELLTHVKEEKPQIYDKKANLLNFNVTILETTSKKFNHSTRETIFVDAFINSIHIDFMMQPVMRLIDYLLVQIIGVVTAPEGFKEDSNIAVSKLIDQKNQIQKNIEQQKNRIDQLQKQFIKTQIINPTNMNIKVEIKSPVIDIKQYKDAINFIRIYLGTTQIENKRFECPKRLITNKYANSSPNYFKAGERPQIYEDQYYIYIEDMKIVIIKEDQMIEVCKPFDFNIKVSMLSFFKELEQCFPQESYDNTMTIESYISPILLKFSNFDYNIIMTAIFHNISYDDGLDQFFIHDFWVTFAEKQKQMDRKYYGLPQQRVQQIQQSNKKERRSTFKFRGIQRLDSLQIETNSLSSEYPQYQKDNSKLDDVIENSDGIYFSLDFQNISLFAVSNENIPFAMVTFDNARVIYDSIDGKSNVKIICKEIDGSYFEKDIDSNIYFEYPLIGSLVKFNLHDEQQIQDLEHLIKQIKKFDASSDDQIIDDEEEEQEDQLNQKNIHVKHKNFKKKHDEHKHQSKKHLNQQKHKGSTQKKHKESGDIKSNEKIFSIPNFKTPRDVEKDLSKQPDFLFPSIENHLADLRLGDKKEQSQEFFTANQKQNALEFSYDSWEKTGEKEMYINLHNITIVAQMGILLQIAGFTKLDEETENIPPPIVPIPQINTAQSPSQQQKEEYQDNYRDNCNNNIMEGTSSKISLNVNNILICTPCMESGNILTLRGQFTVLMNSKQPKPLQELRNMINLGKITREELSQTNVIDEMDVKVEGLEIFICDYDEITHKDFRTVKKREILLPLKIFLSKKKFISVSDDLNQSIEKTLIDLSIQQSSLRISFQDIKLMQDAINYAMTQIQIYNEKSQQIEKEKQEKLKLKQQNQLIKDNLQNTNMSNQLQQQNSINSANNSLQVGISPQVGRRNSQLLNLSRSQTRIMLKNPSQSKFQQIKQEPQQLDRSQQIYGKLSDVASMMFNKNDQNTMNQNSQQLQQQGSQHNLSNIQSMQQLDQSKDKVNMSQQQGNISMTRNKPIPNIELVENHQQLQRMESMSRILQNTNQKLEYRNQSKKSIILNEVFKSNLQESKTNVLLEGFQIVIINDVGNAFTPVLDFMFFDFVMNHSSNVIVDKINAQIQLGINYFNPKVSEWEPIIERVGLEINYLKNELGTTKELITLEPITEHFKCLQINLSSQLIFILSKTFNSFQQEILQQTKNIPTDDKPEEDKKKSVETPHALEYQVSNIKKQQQAFLQPDYSSSQKMKPVNEQKKIFQNVQTQEFEDPTQRYQQLIKKSQLLSQKIHNWEHQRFTIQQQNPNCPQILENVSHVSPYTIKNQTGHQIEIVSDFSYKYDTTSSTTKGSSILCDNKSTTFRVESKLDHFLKINYRGMTASQNLLHGNPNTLNRSNKVKVFLQTEIFKLSSIKNIDLDKVKCQEIVLKIASQESDKNKSNNPFTPSNKGKNISFQQANQLQTPNRPNQSIAQQTQIQSQSQSQSQAAITPIKDLKFRVNTEVKLDINLNRKILILSSPYIFYNNTSIEIMIVLQFRKYKRVLRIQPGEQQGIPIDYLFSFMSISLEDLYLQQDQDNLQVNDENDDGEDLQSIEKIEEILKKRVFSEQISVEECGNQINQNFEVRIGQHFILLKIQPDQVNRHKTIMTFEPPYRFKNCLPKPLRLQIINQNKYTTIDRKIYPNQFFEEFDYPLQKKIYIKVQLEGFFWSDEELIYEGELLTKIKISDLYNSSYISVHQSVSTEAYSCRNYYFYCKALLINETQHSLEFYTKNENKWSSNPMLVGGQFPVFYGERLDDNLVILGEETGNLMVIYDKKCPQKQNKEVSISGVGSTELQVKTKMTLINQQLHPVFIPIGVQVSLKEIEPKIGLFTKIITLSPRIILVNDTAFTIYAKQFQTNSNESGQILTISQRKPLFWLESHKQLLQIGIHEDDVDIQKSYYEQEEMSIPSKKQIKDRKKSIDDFQDHEVCWSGGIEITSVGVVSMCIRDKQNHIVKFVRTDIRMDNSNIYVVIQEVEESQVPYLIANRCEDINIDIPMIPALIELDEKAFFAWDEPHINKNEKELDIILRVNNQKQYQDQPVTIKPDQINMSKKIVIPGKSYGDRKYEDMFIKYTIMVDGYTKVIIFENSSRNELVSQEEKAEFYKKTVKEIKDNYTNTINQSIAVIQESKKKDRIPNNISSFTDAVEDDQQNLAADIPTPQIERYISVYFKKIGLSIINNHSLNEKPQELMYIYMQNTELILLQKKENIIFQFKLKFLNIDNNSQMLVDFPVILTPSHYQSHNSEENSKAFLNLLIEKNTCAYNMNLFNSIIFDIEPVTLKIEEEFVNLILQFVDQIVEGIQTPEENEADFRISKIVRKSYATSVVTRKSVISNTQNMEAIRKPMFWEVQTLPDQSLPTYIDQIILSPININLSFKSKTRANNNFALLTVLATALGVALSNVDDAPLTLKGIKLQNCFDTADGITDKLIQKYKEQALREVFHVLGSLNIIGNPIGFFNNIATGVQDFIEKPIEGLVHGPLEGGMGLALGTASLIKNVMAGTFNSVNKFAGSFSTGIAHLCMDEEFMSQREKMRIKKPKHILDGIEYGVTSIVNGVGRGVIDVFAKPIQGARNGGVKGFLKGTWQGVSGLIIKPLSGILDAASKTAEGITNTATYFDDKPNQRRIRQIRPFYGVEQYFKEYNEIDAEMFMEITRFKGGRFKEATFLNAFILLDDEFNQKSLILLKEALIFMEIRTRKRVWIIPSNQLKSFQQVFDGINIFVNEDNKYLTERKAFVQIKNQNYNKYIHEKLLAYLNLIQDL
ncbi:hypothetical protein ABPG74_018854 [Tetrahymena malaccensis]